MMPFFDLQLIQLIVLFDDKLFDLDWRNRAIISAV